MAVTKNATVEQILPVLQDQNITLIGESRWPDAKAKLRSLPPGIEKHFIGHLQTNKAKDVVEAFDCIESVDSLKLAHAIDKAAQQLGKVMPVFIQVNISNDPSKYGFSPAALSDAIKQFQQLEQFEHLELRGFMTITAKESIEDTRKDFKAMKYLQQKYALPELSMGMSADWEIAAEEGATIVRLGTALFGK